jgi:VIT1/CCC1 family predicted Fe2+/Mn2+ transporter
MKGKISYLEDLYKNEILHMHVYAQLALSEKNKKMASVLKKLSAMEEKHGMYWGEILEINKIRPPHVSTKFFAALILMLRKLFGLALTVKFIEYFEEGLEARFDQIIKNGGLGKNELRIVNKIKVDEDTNERVLEEELIAHGNILNNIRDVIFGLNDGLVELLGVVVGLAAALTDPVLILLGGFIVAVSGTLSMAGGAYLSTEYEKTVVEVGKRTNNATPLRSAFYVGIMYFVGTLCPLSPFIFGIVGTTAIALSIIVTAIVLTVASTIIAIISDTSITKRIGKTLLISLGIAAITITIGIYARMVLNLPV